MKHFVAMIFGLALCAGCDCSGGSTNPDAATFEPDATTGMDGQVPIDGAVDSGVADGGDAGAADSGPFLQRGSIEPAAGGARDSRFQLQGGLRVSTGTSASSRYRLRGRVEPVVR
jgi:hypothetical protein